MYILLMRHGDAVDKSVDAERPLSETGIQQVEKVAEFLELQFPAIKLCCHSEKLRTQQTAEIIHDQLQVEAELQYFTALDPDENALSFCDQVNEFHENTLFVGHLPNVHLFLNNLLAESRQEVINFAYEPATLAILEKQKGSKWKFISKFNPSEPLFE